MPVKCSSDNIFPGACVKKGEETFWVYKVNQKSFYAGKNTYREYEEFYNGRLKGTTFKDFCKRYGFNQYSYEGFEISDEEVLKKEKITAINKIKTSLGKAEKLALKQLLKQNNLFFYMNINVGNSTMRVLAQKNGSLLLSVNNKYLLYNVKEDITVELGSIFDIDMTKNTIPWEKIAV